MFIKHNNGLTSFIFALVLFIAAVSASPLLLDSLPVPEKRAGKTFLGYNGFNGNPRPPQASAGGELGAVFYIADAVDLAKSFARGVDTSKDYVCLVYADSTEWARQPKVWIPQRIIGQGASAVNKAYVGSVLFAPHTNAGLPAGSPREVYQMGIRQAQIARLGVTADCRKKSQFADDHHTLNYPSLTQTWNIQRPA